MALHKIQHPDNFDFVQRVSKGRVMTEQATFAYELSSLGEDVFHFTLASPRWKKRQCLNTLNRDFEKGGQSRLVLDRRGRLSLSGPGMALVGSGGQSIGVNGSAWMVSFDIEPGDRYYGMGEKWGPLEKSGHRSQFYNTDVWADFSGEKVWHADVDAAYASIPYLIVERRGVFLGVLLDNPYRAFMSAGSRFSTWGEPPPDANEPGQDAEFYLGSSGGAPSVYFLVGPTLRELTCKFQRLVGTTPRPPLWALGHHQSRWGYASTRDLLALDREFSRAGIPNDGLWLDIDYMNGYRVFSTKPGVLENSGLQRLSKKRRRVVPILDPGVKVDPGFAVYDEGLSGGHFFLAPSGKPYTGFVWPGRTHFPDFSQKATRGWWAGKVADFKAMGFAGFWIDMNDPATGPVEHDSMLFSKGRVEHAAFHNQYALGMAMATRSGLLAADENERPFVLTRSGSTGIGRYAAMWTGDNVSNEHHLRSAIAVSVNLALSGVPFNGPDVPGFGGNASDDLAERFYQTTFLFPFLRNHSVHDCRRQEPWTFSARTARILRHYIRLRYRFLPYLYQQFVRQEKFGEPILGPCFLDEPSEHPPRGDQYLVGPSVLVAPPLATGEIRDVWLPKGSWFCLRTGSWTQGGRTYRLTTKRGETAVYVRSNTLLPLAGEASLDPEDGGPPTAEALLADIELHVFLKPGESCEWEYVQDDGTSLDYQRGHERTVSFSAKRNRQNVTLDVSLGKSAGLPSLALRRAIVHGLPQTGSLSLPGQRLALRSCRQRFTGKAFSALSTGGRTPALVV